MCSKLSVRALLIPILTFLLQWQLVHGADKPYITRKPQSVFNGNPYCKSGRPYSSCTCPSYKPDCGRVYSGGTSRREYCDRNQALPCDELDALTTFLTGLGVTDFNVSHCENSSNLVAGAEIRYNCSFKDKDGNFTCHITEINMMSSLLSGYMDDAISGLQHLQILDLSSNQLTGSLPQSMGNLTSLTDLNLENNQLGGTIPNSFQALNSLEYLDLTFNFLNQSIPKSFGNLSSLETLYLDSNMLSGPIPDELGNLTQLDFLWLNSNYLTGEIPQSYSQLTGLEIFAVAGNYLSGPLRDYIANWTNLTHLVLRNCSINDTIPPYIAKWPELTHLDLSFNNLNGEIQQFNTGTILLSRNKFKGKFPPWISELSPQLYRSLELEYIYQKGKKCRKKTHSLSINCGGDKVNFDKQNYENDTAISNFYESPDGNWAYSVSGDFITPTTIENLTCGVSVPEGDLYVNARVAPISLTYYAFCLHKGKYRIKLFFAETSFSKNEDHSILKKRIFDVHIQKKKVLQDFNIQKEAKGAKYKNIMKSFTATIRDHEPLQIDFFWAGRGSLDKNGPLVSAISITHETRIKLSETQAYSVKEIINATQKFSPKTHIGKDGRFGIVYKAVLPNLTVAVKKLFPQSKAAAEIRAEVFALSKLENQNLVKLLGSYSKRGLHLLIYEYMENGSLEEVLFDANRSAHLSWEKRYKICEQIALGLEFLHKMEPPVIHRNIKASNILLDRDYNAKISDFGLAKLYEEDDPFMFTKDPRSALKYMAPEYASQKNITVKIDVYSFGLLLLEIISGKEIDKNLGDPDNSIYLLEKADMCRKQKMYEQLIDETLKERPSGRVPSTTLYQAITVIELAMLCTDWPSIRPPISDVVSVLQGKITVEDMTKV
ncbi:hypothetical protein JCGZ_25363 [Jatropha curcas]|uniref:non-specific serine/threonine protein kinase n=1 Tax=Jatropha curcas TaxID=180498 RepID=A0A067JVF4_JATCU|nr:hypothetical protein JCGZ_25363 [Jatropha curcas]